MEAVANKSDETPKEILTREYSKRLGNIALWPLKFTGYLRFEIKDGHFLEKFRSTVIRSVIMLIFSNICGAYMLFICEFVEHYTTITESITIFYLILLQTSTHLNIVFPNRNSGLVIINTCIKIDVILGYKETQFMRDIAATACAVLGVAIIVFQIVVIIVLLTGYSVSVAVHLAGCVFFGMIFLIFFDPCFLVVFLTFLSLRVHYINIALTKLANVNPEYFANQFFFNGILWRKKFDKSVTFHHSAEAAQFTELFGHIFELLRQIEKCFKFNTFVCLTSVITGTFVGVQTIIINKDRPDVNELRTISVTGWVLLGWLYLFSTGQHIDIFCRQIEKTKLICNYIQLKPAMSPNVLKITKDVLRLLEAYEIRVSLYNMFYYNTNLFLQVFGSIFVYITVQLQLLVPATSPPGQQLLSNTTNDSPNNFMLF